MRLAEHTPERIVLRHRAWELWLPFGAALAGLGWGGLAPAMQGRGLDGLPYALALPVLVFLAHRLLRPSAVIGDLTAGTVTILRGPLLRRERIVFPLDEVAGAVCRRRQLDRGDPDAHVAWMALQCHRGDMAGEHRITGFAPFARPCRDAGLLDAWIAQAHENRH